MRQEPHAGPLLTRRRRPDGGRTRSDPASTWPGLRPRCRLASTRLSPTWAIGGNATCCRSRRSSTPAGCTRRAWPLATRSSSGRPVRTGLRAAVSRRQRRGRAHPPRGMGARGRIGDLTRQVRSLTYLTVCDRRSRRVDAVERHARQCLEPRRTAASPSTWAPRRPILPGPTSAGMSPRRKSAAGRRWRSGAAWTPRSHSGWLAALPLLADPLRQARSGDLAANGGTAARGGPAAPARPVDHGARGGRARRVAIARTRRCERPWGRSS